MSNPSQRVKTAATLQLLSGVIDTWFMGACMWGLLGSGLGSLTASIGHIGGLWGWAACLLVPFGVLEMTVALRVRAHPETSVAWCRRLAAAQIASIVLGGATACGVGLFTLYWLKRA